MKTNYYIAAKFSTLLLLLLAYCFCAPHQACAQEENNIKVTVKLYTTDKNGKEVPQELDTAMFAFKMCQVTITNLRTEARYRPCEEDGSITIKVRRQDKLRISAPDYRTCEVKVGKKMGDIEVRLVSLDCLQDEVIIPMSSPKK